MRRCVLVVVLAACGVELPPEDGGFTSRLDAGAKPFDAGRPVVDAGSGFERDASVAGFDAGLGEPSNDAGDSRIIDAGAFDAGLPPTCGRCIRYGSVSNAGTVKRAELNEASGLVASRAHPGVLYSHNDSAGRPVVYVMSTSGDDLGELVLTGAVNADWEDMALGPCPTGTCLYIGEIGDNSMVNPGPYAIYRVAEPNVSPSASLGSVSVSYERLALRYPNDEKYDAETLMVHPLTGDVYVVTKPALLKKATAYKATAPLSASAPNDLIKVGTMKIPDGLNLQVTGGDIDACGTTMLIRTYDEMYQFTVPAGAPFDGIFTSSFSRVPTPIFKVQENQGEAVGWAAGGGYYTLSEGTSQMLHFVGCQ